MKADCSTQEEISRLLDVGVAVKSAPCESDCQGCRGRIAAHLMVAAKRLSKNMIVIKGTQEVQSLATHLKVMV